MGRYSFTQEMVELFAEGRTKGIFQLDRQSNWSKKTEPENLEQLSDLIAIIRPGCVSGDTKVYVKKYDKRGHKKVAIRDIFKDSDKYDTIMSLDTTHGTSKLYENTVEDVIYSGKKECFRVNVVRYLQDAINRRMSGNWYNLECTDDHKLLTPNGWIELKDLKVGDRIAVLAKNGDRTSSNSVKDGLTEPVRGNKYFQEICYQNYEVKCLFCDWNKASLDVNHIDGNRYVDNSAENLCFLCPNHHREYTEGQIPRFRLLRARKELILPQYKGFVWGTFTGKESVGVKDTYDISMLAPNHNFIAGNVVVHNCTKAIMDGKSMTQWYVDRKNGTEPLEYIHIALEPILAATQGVLVYQEQAMTISVELADFNLQEADDLRKAIGKKKADLMKKVRVKFENGCIITKIVNQEEADEIFGWIEKSARYSFNKCLSLDTVVITPSGQKCLFEIKVGDKVLAPIENGDDEFIDVLDVVDSGEKESYEVTLSNGDSIVCSIDHKFKVKDGRILPLYQIIDEDLEILVYNK